ncbi:L-amino acid N-acyltransferase YncA [Kribbella orskensis]|uniref:L-amino acid N-acyltransferase YncA n=1 Tax=Kribbella orskensis TaxID=2512216 RepID=A0ABY2B8J0_9ACTN|nr:MULTISPECIES: GNAT family N-acetyltransferase [Kribbella]TCN30582.1 L-amino acid N-acyltransferase YncA [Kribbella sp. VKM Ac-2500]TCO11315.1 L-amino acid N-acyltransferase YncA [Kribbella orskensis]
MQNDERIRRARPDDVPAIVDLVYGLAEYERAPQECRLTAEQLQTALFGDKPAVFCHVAETGAEVVGCALWFLNFSTWRGVHGIYLEDLFVRPEQRGSGLGKALLVALAQECVSNGYERLEWSVLDWNTPAIDFYKSLGVLPQDEWITFRLTDTALTQLGS